MISCFLEGMQGRLHYLDYNQESLTPEPPDVFAPLEPETDLPTLIFLPGLTNHAHYWDEIAPAFLENYKVYALDWRGHGDSAHSPGYGYADYATDITRLVNTLLPSRYFLAGHSLGGYVALYYASLIDENSTLAGVVAADIKTSSTEEEHEAGQRAGARVQPFIASLDDVAARLKAAMPDSSVSHERLLQLAEESAAFEGTAYRLKYDRQVLDFEPVDPYAFAEKVNLPVLVINGANSGIMNAKQSRELAKAIPEAKRVEITDAGHFVYLDQPAEFAEKVNDFLAKTLKKVK